jgi:hypothetical protein
MIPKIFDVVREIFFEIPVPSSRVQRAKTFFSPSKNFYMSINRGLCVDYTGWKLISYDINF